MFGHRSDGKKVKGMTIIEKAEPFFMPQRIDAVNYVNVKAPCGPLDEFIAREKKNGNHFTYMHSIYQRNYISISLDIKKKLEEEAEDVTCKFYFTGRESLSEVAKIVDDEIAKNLVADNVHRTTKIAGRFCKLPDFLFRWALAICRWLDRHGILPKSLIKASPFHTSCFLTNLKSIKLPYIYHHLYNFGTTSMFVAMGKEKVEPYVENNKELKLGKFITCGITLDERVADGFYMSKTLKLFKDLLANPDSLMESLPDDGTIPKKLLKKNKKSSKNKKENKPKKIKPLENKKKHDKKLKKDNVNDSNF